MINLQLKLGREKSILQHHPWIFSGAIEKVDGLPSPGETVRVLDSKHLCLGFAAYSPASQIRARMWSWDPEEIINLDFLKSRLSASLNLRKTLKLSDQTTAYRLVNAESDGIPGLIVDRYNDILVFQLLSAGAEFWRESLVDLMIGLTGIDNIYERSDAEVRHLEGLPERIGSLRGSFNEKQVLICENGLYFWVDLKHGHKTGFYLDQRENRARIMKYSKDLSILNCFCYTGGFTIYALAGGAANILSVDSSSEVLSLGAKNIIQNQLPEDRAEWLQGDVFKVLRKLRDQARSFDLVILDPPKFAPTAAQADQAARGYKDINLLAFKLLKPGGFLFTFSCSGGISSEFFQKIVAEAALDADVNARIVEYLFQAGDHPVGVNFTQGIYLKGLVCQVW
jgi:23S rRNA (cytosine1962-C5)-methyltransferase